ncbi:uncharacterized protein LOC123550105 [Mercenaria mercenaria]|uniref:uncharacterized protein LOC123550105 n=1 Tax=Mercenaria mercenaria TaxID=6596 RepID=UPI00234E8FCF|nr:uncharacterized protein LOC123550105 [Mercenaria mercenaria]
MFQGPDYTRNVSMRLSEILADIGVNERIVLKRRRALLLIESLSHTSQQLQDWNIFIYKLGSQSEGTTTLGLNSDSDSLYCNNDFSVIKDWSGWEPGVCSLLMIQDEMVSPGYCLLQCLRNDSPHPYNNVRNHFHFKDRKGRILMKNTIIPASTANVGGVRHGPAQALQGRPGLTDDDLVAAFPCKTPLQTLRGLDWPGVGQWPSNNMRRYCNNSRCFVVAVGSKDSEIEELEWRISTPLAERCLIFNLNITQIRCFILMKMILKTYFKPQFGDTVSSFMCKTVLFHCIANTHSNIWREYNLLVCLSLCFCSLYNSILNENCPHFFIPENNLMRGHIPHEFKPHILDILQHIINSKGTALLRIECVKIGTRLQFKLNGMLSLQLSDIVSGHLIKLSAESFHTEIWHCLKHYRNSSYQVVIGALLKQILKLVIISNQGHGLDKLSCCLLAPPFCTAPGSVLASLSIQQYNCISAEALTWISMGLNADVASGKLKLASMFYCFRDAQRTEIVLGDVEGSYDLHCVESICGCHSFAKILKRGFNAIADNHKEEAIQHIAAFCVRYLQCEINCVPHELQYEFFRSIEEELVLRSDEEDWNWMDCAVVDSLPYMYFLQYKTYGYLGRQDDKKTALSNLVKTIDQEPNLRHRETALNLLGQCMEEEDRAVDALRCYSISLDKRGENNAAKIHLCRLLSKIANN